MPTTFQKLIKRFPVAVMSISVILFLGVQAVFSFCGKKTCLAFNHAGHDTWFPYKTEQTMVFANSGDRDTLTLSSINRSEARTISVGYGSSHCYALAEIFGKFTRPNADSSYGNFSTYFMLDDNGIINSGSLRFRGIALSVENVTDTGIVIGNTTAAYSNFQSTLVLNGVTYANVQTITPTVIDKNTSFSHLYIAKTRGIIAYEEWPSGRLWIKQ